MRPSLASRALGSRVFATGIVGIMLLSSLAVLGGPVAASHPGPASSATGSTTAPARSPSAPGTADSDSPVLGACASGTSGPTRSPLSSPVPGATSPTPLYNSLVQPYAVLTGPYGYVAGGAALRDLGYGQINLTWPTPDQLVAAYMIWAIMDNVTPPAYGTLNGVNVTGTWSAYATPSPCWAPTYIYTFVADVTSDVSNGVNTLTGFPSGVTSGADPWSAPQIDPMDEGLTLVAIYENGSTTDHEVTVYTGAYTTEGGSITADVNYSTANRSSATTTYLVADGQLYGNYAVWNGTEVDSNAFPGTAPKETSTVWSFGNLYDTKTYNVTVPVGSNSTLAEIGSTEGDCITWIGQVLSVGVAALPGPYNVTFEERGLPNGTSWSVTTNNATTSLTQSGVVADLSSKISFSLYNGSYTYSVGAVPGYRAQVGHPYLVEGGPILIQVLFHLVLYPVVFNETGLPDTQAWWTDLANSTQGLVENNSVAAGTLIDDFVPNGTYQYTAGEFGLYRAVPPNGTITMSGAPILVNVTFVPPSLFNITFEEQGLRFGTVWGGSVYSNFGAYSNVTNETSFTLQLPNTTYVDEFDSNPVPGYQSPGVLFFAVHATSETIDVNYTQVFLVTLNQTGLPLSTDWSAYLSGGSGTRYNSSAGSDLYFWVPNGTYTFTVESVWAYTAVPNSGPVNITGANVTIAIQFRLAPTYWLNFTETGLPAGTVWSIEVQLPNYTVLEFTTPNSTISLQEPNGSYYFSMGPDLNVTGPQVYYLGAPSHGYLYVTGSNVTQPIEFTPVYRVTFNESGLVTGAFWEVFLNASYGYSYGSQIGFLEGNGSYPFTIDGPYGWNATPDSGTLVVDGANISVQVNFTSKIYVTYPVTFAESGLPSGTEWYVYLGEAAVYSNGTSLNFTETNGTYYFYVYGPSGLVTNPASGSLVVNGSAVVENITFSLPEFWITFIESGLPSGTEWWVNFTGGPSLTSNNTTIQIALPDGFYNVTTGCANTSYVCGGHEGFLVDGYNMTEYETFFLLTRAVTFNETGLPTGTEWWANITGQSPLSSYQANATTFLPNGTYHYTIGSSNKEYAAAAGEFEVAGHNVSVTVTFELVTFTVTFAESGLPSGSEWWVNISGETSLSTTGSTLTIALPNGTYDYRVATANKHYDGSPGGFQVDGSSVSVPVPFALVVYSVTFTETGLPSGTEWWVNASGQPPRSSTSLTLTVEWPNGTYAYTVATTDKEFASPASGVTVNGGPAAANVPFTLVVFEITYTESGLPSGTQWWVNLSGESPLSSTSTTLSISLPNGSYPYTVATVDKEYSARPGDLAVTGGPAGVDVAFALVLYTVTVTETGLPSSTQWWVNLTGASSLSATTVSITTELPNGSYQFGVASAQRSYTASDGNFTVDGNPQLVKVTFSPPGTAQVLGLPASEGYATIGGIVAVIGLLLALALARRRKKQQKPEVFGPPAGAAGGPHPPPPAP